jgi:hypothetical protein
MNTIEVSCTGCEKAITVETEARRVRCRGCKTVFDNPHYAPGFEELRPALEAPEEAGLALGKGLLLTIAGLVLAIGGIAAMTSGEANRGAIKVAGVGFALLGAGVFTLYGAYADRRVRA